jgi:hypothetical protein
MIFPRFFRLPKGTPCYQISRLRNYDGGFTMVEFAMDSFALKPPGQVLLDTDGMPAQDGLMRWRELLFDTIPLVQDIQPIGAQKKTPGLFKARTSLQFVGECALLSATLSHDFTLRYVRGQVEISRTHVDTP